MVLMTMNQHEQRFYARAADMLAAMYLHRPNGRLTIAFTEAIGVLHEGLGLTDDFSNEADPLPDLRADYDALFFVPVSGRYLPPYESAQRTRRLWGPITHQVAAFYASVSFDPATLHMDEHWLHLDAPDHAGVELACLSALLRTNANVPDPAVESALQYFIRNHLARWLPDFGRQLAENASTSHYRLLGTLTRSLVLGLLTED